MNLEELNYDELLKKKPYDGDLVFNVNGMTADEYISKITEEMNAIDLSSVPIDKWDIVVTFSLAALEVAGDFFIGDPSFKHSLANKNGPFCKWLDKFHQHQAGSPMDYQGDGFSGGAHRAKTFAHDPPLARAIYGAKADEKGEKGAIKKTYNAALWAHDILCFALAIYSISSGKFIDCTFTKDGKYKWIVESVNQNGNPYDSCNVFVAIVRYLVHMLADFCSSASLPIPGFSLLTHFSDRDVEAFAMKLYRNGMNLRTMAMQGIPVALTELLMSLYIWIRSKGCNGEFSETACEHKKHKLLLISHGITTAVNIGKVIITKAPWRLNLIVIARTFHLVWLVAAEEARLTNRHIEKLDSGILKARLESCKTLVLLDEAVYETENVDRMLRTLSQRMKETSLNIDSSIAELDSEFKTMLEKIGG